MLPMTTRIAQDRVVFAKRLFHLHVSPMMPHARSSSSSCLHMSVPLSSVSSLSSTSTSQVTLPINKHCDDPQNEQMALWPKQLLLQVMSPTWSTTPTTQRLIQRSSRVNPSTLTRNCRTRSMRNSTISSSEKRYLHYCSIRSEKNQRTWEKLIILMKKVCYQLSLFSHEQVRGNLCTNQVQICLKNGNQVATRKASKSSVSFKDKKSKFLLESDLRSRSTNFKPSLTEEVSMNWLELLSLSAWKLIILLEGVSNPGEINYTTSRRNVKTKSGSSWKLYQEYARHEELQKSHVLKVDELSRRKLTEDFEAVTSFFQGSNVKTVYNFGDNDAKYPDAEIDDVHTRNSLASPLHLQEREASASLLQAFAHKEKAWFNVHSQFSASTAKPVTGCHKKRQSNQELDKCQTRIIFGKTREQLLVEAKSETCEMNTERILPKNNICELKREIENQAVKIGHTRTGYDQSRREQALLHEELADRERALRDTRSGSIQKLEELKRDQEFRLEEFSIRKLSKIILKMSNLYAVDTYFTFRVNLRYFLIPREPGGLLCRD